MQGAHGAILGTGSGFPGTVSAEHVIGSGSSPFAVTALRPTSPQRPTREPHTHELKIIRLL